MCDVYENDNGISTYSVFCRGGTGPYDPPLLLRYGPQCQGCVWFTISDLQNVLLHILKKRDFENNGYIFDKEEKEKKNLFVRIKIQIHYFKRFKNIFKSPIFKIFFF